MTSERQTMNIAQNHIYIIIYDQLRCGLPDSVTAPPLGDWRFLNTWFSEAMLSCPQPHYGFTTCTLGRVGEVYAHLLPWTKSCLALVKFTFLAPQNTCLIMES